MLRYLALSLIISHIPGKIVPRYLHLFYSCNYQVAVASVDIHAVLVILRKNELPIKSRQRKNAWASILCVADYYAFSTDQQLSRPKEHLT